MFELVLSEPIVLQQHEALLRRTPENHPLRHEIEGQTKILRSGFWGEKTLSYYLSLLPQKNYHIYHGLRLPIEDKFFQMDALLISDKYGCIIDAKNFSGDILIEKHQLSRTYKDETSTFSNPVSQVNRHRLLLNHWLEKYQIPLVPLENLVSFSNPSSKITIANGYYEAEKKVCKSENILSKIDEFEKRYHKVSIDSKNLGKMKRALLSKHTPLRINILEKFGVVNSDVITGVQCSNCLFLPLIYKNGKWTCPHCQAQSKQDYLNAIRDFFLIHHPWITNAELREFLHLPSPRSATYHFSILKFSSTGTFKNRTYQQPKDFL